MRILKSTLRRIIAEATLPDDPDAKELAAKISILLEQYQYLTRSEMQQAADAAIDLFFPPER